MLHREKKNVLYLSLKIFRGLLVFMFKYWKKYRRRKKNLVFMGFKKVPGTEKENLLYRWLLQYFLRDK